MQSLHEPFNYKANISIPKEFELELFDGFIAYPSAAVKNCYSKNDFGLVVVNFCVHCVQPLPKGVVPFARLPQGFIPSARAIGASNINSTEYGARVVVRSLVEGSDAGIIDIGVNAETVSTFEGSLCYYAQ